MFGDLIHQTTQDTGTGALDLTALNGRRSFDDEFATGGTDAFYYFITHRTAAEWEVGTGHLADGDTLIRDTVLASSNSGSAVNFSAGVKDITNDIPSSVRVTTDDIGVTVQGYDAQLAEWATVDPSENGKSLVSAADYAAMRALLDLEAGTDFLTPAAIAAAYQPLDADLTSIAALSTAAYGRSLLTLANATALAGEVDSFFLTPAEGNAAYQPLDADLTAIAALTTTAAGRTSLTITDPNADRMMAWDDSVGAVVPIAAADIATEAAPASGDFLLAYVDGALAKVDWSELPGASSGITEVVEDTSPQLGGTLDLNGQDITGTGNISITGTVTVTDEAYDATGWNADLSVPTKNAVRDYLETLTGTTLPAAYQPLDAQLTEWAGVDPSDNGKSLVAAADYAAMRALLDLEAGTDFYSKAAADAAFQPLDADLTSWAGVTRASGFDTFAATPSSANLRALLSDEAGTGAAYFVGGDAGTPSAINLTNGTSLPLSGVTDSTTEALGVGTLELGHASDTTLSRSSAGVLAVEGVVVPTISSTSTLTNKTIDLTNNTLVGSVSEFNAALESADFYTTGGTDVAIADGGTGASTASAAFNNLKQAASESATGVVELATTAEALAGTDTARAVTPAGLATRSREKLSGARTYYVRSDGSDSNTGLVNSSGGAFATLNKARDVILTLDLNGFDATIKIGNTATLTAGLNFVSPPIGGNVILEGDTGTPANTIISVTGDGAVSVQTPMRLTVRSVELRTTTSGSCLFASAPGSRIQIESGIRFGACAEYHIRSVGGGYIQNVASNYTISGGAQQHYSAAVGGAIEVALSTVTVSGTPAFSQAFALASTSGILSAFSMTYSGSATGTRYSSTLNSVINTFGGGASFFPGNAAGSTATGGQYA